MHRFLLFCIAATLMMMALPAAAQYDDPCGVFRDANCVPIVVNNDGTGSGGGGNYSYCAARQSQGEQCQDVVTVTIPDSICGTGCEMCASVKFSASCSCDPNTKKTTGTCTYW